MNRNLLLSVVSVLAALLFTIHVADDIVRGFDRAGPQNAFGMAMLIVWLYAALVLAERRSGLVIMLLFGLVSALMPLVHLSGGTVPTRAFAQTPGALFFLWTLWAITATGGLSVVLAIRGLVASRAKVRTA